LPCCGFEQIGSPNDFRDFHLGIVNDYRQMIRRYVITTPNDEVSQIPSGDKSLKSPVDVVEGNCFSIGNSKSPIHADWKIKLLCIGSRAAATRIDRLIIEVMRSRGRQR
jgi:hypothetical protein